jgi:hypothetical protein
MRVSAVAASTARRSGTSLGSRILLTPGLNPIKEWAYAGAIITYISAVASHRTVGDGIGTFVGPTVLLTVTAVCTRQ